MANAPSLKRRYSTLEETIRQRRQGGASVSEDASVRPGGRRAPRGLSRRRSVPSGPEVKMMRQALWARGRRGTASVEFALVLPLLLALLFGIIEFGFVFKDQLSLQQAAREGARVAAVGRPVAEVGVRIVSSASSLDTDSLTYDVMSRTYASSAWSSWAALGDNDDGTENDAEQGAQIRVRCDYSHALLTGPLFARLIGRPGETELPLHAEMVMRRE